MYCTVKYGTVGRPAFFIGGSDAICVSARLEALPFLQLSEKSKPGMSVYGGCGSRKSC